MAHTCNELVSLTGLAEQDVTRYMEAFQAMDLEDGAASAPDLRLCLQSLGYKPTDEELLKLVLVAQWEQHTSFVDVDGFVFLMKAIVSQEVPCTLRVTGEIR
jgi:Ca2+-binding EF-hand superfamily protein